MRSLYLIALACALATNAAAGEIMQGSKVKKKTAAGKKATVSGEYSPLRPVAHNFGVDRSRIHTNERISLNGRRIGMTEARERLHPTSAKLPNDGAKLRITVIGSATKRKAVVDDWNRNPALAGFREDFVIQDYPPDHWAVSRVGFFLQGDPTISVQRPNGAELHRQHDYDGGAETLALALRKARDGYDPAKVKDLRKGGLSGLLGLSLPWSVAVLAALGAGILFLPTEKK